MAVEIRHLQRSEVREVEEAFGKGQKGSSAMPHKRNPIGSENITGCARLLRGYMVAAMENVALWHERDISHSSVERVVLPDATNLVVNAGRMRKNLDATHGLYNSQRLMLRLIDCGLTREEAYDLVQPLAMQSWQNDQRFQPLVMSSDAIMAHISPEEVEKLFDATYHTKHVELLLARAGIRDHNS